jgi:catechol 2,3-dioxygenase-like lactoylglutathione lyase family enzyme
MEANSFDHVALWVEDRERLGGFLLETLGVHEISRGDDFTLLGADARQGKLTLFDAGGSPEAGVLGRVVLRVSDLDAARRSLPGGQTLLSAPGGPELEIVESSNGGPDYDLDHVVLRVPDPGATAAGLAELGFAREGERLHVGDRHVRLEPGPEPQGDPMLNHLALLVDSAEELRGEAEHRGLEIDKVVDAENTLAVFVRGPDAITVEYVEHKPGFALV